MHGSSNALVDRSAEGPHQRGSGCSFKRGQGVSFKSPIQKQLDLSLARGLIVSLLLNITRFAQHIPRRFPLSGKLYISWSPSACMCGTRPTNGPIIMESCPLSARQEKAWRTSMHVCVIAWSYRYSVDCEGAAALFHLGKQVESGTMP